MKVFFAILAWISSPCFSPAQLESLRIHASFTEVNDYCPDAVTAERTAASRLQCLHFCGRNAQCTHLYVSELNSGQVRCLMMKNFVGCAVSLPFKGFKFNAARNQPLSTVVLGERQYCMGNRDESFAPFTFNLKTGDYRIRLMYVNGSLTCNPTVDRRPSKWGCDHPHYGPASVKLTVITDDLRNFIVPQSAFNEDDGRMAHSSYIGTTSCIRFDQRKKYRVYQEEDMLNQYEGNNSGRVCFTVIVDSGPCST